MKIGRANSPMNKTEVVVLTADLDFASQARQTFGASEQITLRVISGAVSLLEGSFEPAGATVVVVDLDFQHGSCADYLDLEPRLDLGEIEGRPERLDRQLLEVMLSHHPSGLAVVAAPNRPAEMRSFDPDVVTRLLDLVSSHFDHVV